MVLVILGLLVGGVITGQSLLRASQVRSVVKEYETYSTAMVNFKQKYNGIPGDIGNATTYFGWQGGTGCVNNAGTIGSTVLGACDGNGDQIITHANTANATSEAFQGWRQLALAGLIPGSYTGLAGPVAVGGTAANYVPRVNSPAGKISPSAWGMTYFDNSAPIMSSVYTVDYRNWFMVGDPTDGVYADDPFLKPEEAYNIDVKIDDGKTNSGDVNVTTACEDGNNTGTYRLDATTNLCAMLFRAP